MFKFLANIDIITLVSKRGSNTYGDEMVTPAPSAPIIAPAPAEQAAVIQDTPAASGSDYGAIVPAPPSPDPVATTLASASPAVQESISQAYRRFMFKLRRMRMRRFRH